MDTTSDTKGRIRLDELVFSDDNALTVKKIVDNIRNSQKYTSCGVGLANRILLYGSLGSGRKTLSSCIAEETGVKYLCISAAEFLSGNGAGRIEEVFREANDNRPCLLFVDEIELIASLNPNSTINETLRFSEFIRKAEDILEEDVFLVVSANSSYLLNEMITEKFRTVVNLDEINGEMLYRFIKNFLYSKNCLDLSEKDISSVFRIISGNFSELKTFHGVKSCIDDVLGNLIMESISKNVSQTDEIRIKGEKLVRSLEDSLSGTPVKSAIETAYHEAAHSVLSILFGRSFSFVTILARKDYGGYSAANRDISTETAIRQQMMISMAGRAAEVIYADGDETYSINVGACSDFENATRFAYFYLCKAALDKKRLTVISFSGPGPDSFIPENRLLPESMREELWRDVEDLMQEMWKETLNTVRQFWDRIDALAITLMYTDSVSQEIAYRVVQTGHPYFDEETERQIRRRLGNMDSVPCRNDAGLFFANEYQAQLDKMYALFGNNDTEDLGFPNDLPLQDQLDCYITGLLTGRITGNCSMDLSPDEKLSLIVNKTFWDICGRRLDEDLQKSFSDPTIEISEESVRCKMLIFLYKNMIIGSLKDTVLNLFDGLSIPAPNDGSSLESWLEKNTMPFLKKEFKTSDPDAAIIKAFLKETADLEPANIGCPIYPVTQIAYRDFSRDYESVDEDAKLYYVIKCPANAALKNDINSAMREIASLRRQFGDRNVSCRCFTDFEAACDYLYTAELLISREGKNRRFEIVTDGAAIMDLPIDKNNSLSFVLDISAEEFVGLQNSPELAGNNVVNYIVGSLNSFARNFPADFDFRILIKFNAYVNIEGQDKADNSQKLLVLIRNQIAQIREFSERNLI